MPTRHRLIPCLTLVLLFGLSSCAFAQTPDITGVWSINAALSDNTDKRVEAALRAAGEKIQSSWFDRRKDRYRGGPAEQELYDRMSYDSTLRISLDADADAYDFTYADAFSRLVYTDNRSHSVSLNALDTAADFSLGHWEGEVFKVEAHPRDGGYAEESYRLSNGGKQLHVELYILPRAFREAITLKRVYDKQ